MILLTDEGIPRKYKTTLALSPDKQTQYLLDNIYKEGAKAQLKKVAEDILTQIGSYSRTADDKIVWLPLGRIQENGIIKYSEFWQSLLEEVKCLD